MAVIKCKMCGGDMELTADKTFGTCEYCGSTMTLPKVDDEQRAAAFNRGNHFRRIGEFDKALAVYERIVREDDTDAEAHWCCALCRFGIEYVEDPTTYEWLPTCHRASFDNFLEDVDYKAALEYSDGITRRQYLKDGAKIAEVQRGILATSQNTEPYDVFICYKESDENGERTRDSLMAQDIYYQLTEQGRKVFFARITLEDIAGTQYEPYIFAALNSAKVMIVVGTKPEYMNAVWVKNEWSRFLAMMKKDRHKLLLPCYRDMDPYDMPEQLSVLQSYDMAKIGFIQDLTRGIAKVLDAEKKPESVKETVVVQQSAAPTNTAPLLKRAFMFLEDGDWASADEYCEKVLDMEPENAQAYLGKLMAELCVSKVEELRDEQEPFDDENNYHKVIRFADDALRNTLKGYIEHINARNENARLNGIYNNAKRVMDTAKTEFSFKEAARMFLTIPDYEDSSSLAQECYELAEVARKDAIFTEAKLHMMENNLFYKVEKAIELFESIPGWKDADERIIICRQKIEEIKAREAAEQQERERQTELARREAARIAKRNKKIILIAAAILMIAVAAAILVTKVIIPGNAYKEAEELFSNGKYGEAYVAFEALDGFKDSDKRIVECKAAIKDLQIANLEEKYNTAVALMNESKYEKARIAFNALGDFKDSKKRATECESAQENLAEYAAAEELANSGKTAEAAIAFNRLGDFQDAPKRSLSLWDSVAVRNTLSAGRFHTVGLKNDGTMLAVGFNQYGQCDVSDWTDILAVSAGGCFTIGLKSDGTVVSTGANEEGQCNVQNWNNIVAVSTGEYHTVGLKSDGTVVATGWNQYGQCDVENWTDIVAISAGQYHTVGLKSDGTVVAVGRNEHSQCNIDNWKDIIAVAAGTYHTVGLQSNGKVVVVGNNSASWFDVGFTSSKGGFIATTNPENKWCNVNDWTDIVAIDAGAAQTIGIRSDGTVIAVGDNVNGRCDVGDWTDIVAIDTRNIHTVGLKSDGTVVIVGSDEDGQCNVTDWKDIKLPQ